MGVLPDGEGLGSPVRSLDFLPWISAGSADGELGEPSSWK